MNKLLIDGDIPAYMCAAAGDGHKWVASDGHKERYKKDIAAYCEDNELDVKDLTEVYEPEPIANVLHSVKLMLTNSIFDAFDSVDSYEIFLTDSAGNYRNDIGTIQKYKGNRDGQRRPQHLSACKAYLEEWGAKVTTGQEADDACGIAQTDETVVVSTDKDLLMISGRHFNFVTQTHSEVSELEGTRRFYKQLLTGDGTDNILGLFNIGKKATCVKAIDSYDTEADMFGSVLFEYERRFGNYAKQFMLENGRLLYIRREPDQMWEFPKEV